MTMMKAIKFLLLAILVGIMAGCKLAVIVVEGGEVQSDGSGTCVSSAICVVDVSDPYFSETFKAVPDEGWYFEKWNSGDSFFCGGSPDPNCTLSFEGQEESKAVEDMVASSEVFFLMPVFRPYPEDIITVNGNEWLQPALFTNLSWNDINAVCPAGVCSGELNGYDMTGWTWASIDDVNALFNSYQKAGKAILEDFVDTATDKGTRIIFATLSDPPNEDRASWAVVASGTAEIRITSSEGPGRSESASTVGAWFWRPAD